MSLENAFIEQLAQYIEINYKEYLPVTVIKLAGSTDGEYFIRICGKATWKSVKSI